MTAAMVAAVVLGGLGLFGCSYQALEEEKTIKRDAEGRRLVDFSVPTESYGGGGPRALNAEVAQSSWDYVQIVFEFDVDEDDVFGDAENRFYVGSAIRGATIRFSLPEGRYRALMFLGTNTDELRLLATGAVTGVKDASNVYIEEGITDGLFEITPDVRIVEFTASALVSDIEEGGALTFSGPEPKSAPDNVTTILGGGLVPYFNIPPATQDNYGTPGAIAGTFAFSGFPDVIAPPDAEVELGSATPAADGWFDLAGDKETMIQNIGVFAYNRVTKMDLAPVPVTGTVQTVRLTAGKLEIDFGLKTSDSEGLEIGFNKLQFFAEVQAFRNGLGGGDKGEVWRIANGFRPGEMDAGGVSLGQNILLMVGDPELATDLTNLIDIIVANASVDIAGPFYVRSDGSDGADGSEEYPFLTLKYAYDAAVEDPKRKTVVVMSDLVATDAVELDTLHPMTITIKSFNGTPPALTRSSGENDSVIKVSNGARIKFQNIKIDGKTEGYPNRALSVTGVGTKVTIVHGMILTGKLTEANKYGGAVFIDTGAWFQMDGGEIVDSEVVGNTYGGGGGVYIKGSASGVSTFTMSGGKISRNTATMYGGGVCAYGKVTFTMSGGEISYNTLNTSGGGGVALISNVNFMMIGGEIKGNAVVNTGLGGGLFSMLGATADMTGGYIYGADAEEGLANTATSGNAAAFRSSTMDKGNIPSTNDTIDGSTL
jgi:hypothetical protein